MLTIAQIDHYQTFGFFVVRALLGADQAARLRGEVDAAIRDAFAATYDGRVIAGDQRPLPADGLPAHPDQ